MYHKANEELLTNYKHHDYQPKGIDYETYIINELIAIGYDATGTPGSYDQGVDIVIHLFQDVTIIIQCKYFHHPVGNKAIQEIQAAKALYHASLCIVTTNSDFTNSAVELAKANHVTLISGFDIGDDITDFVLQAGLVPKKFIQCYLPILNPCAYKLLSENQTTDLKLEIPDENTTDVSTEESDIDTNSESIEPAISDEDIIQDFLTVFLKDCNYDILPFEFLYDGYKSWLNLQDNICIKPVKKNKFTGIIIYLIESNPEWMYTEKSVRLNITEFRSKLENIIEEFELTEWKYIATDRVKGIMKKAAIENKTTASIIKQDPQNEVAQFLDLFSPKLVWDFVPLKFLYDLYKSYYKKEKQKEPSIMYKSFNKLVKIWCDVNFTWMIPTNKKGGIAPTRHRNRMNKPEPLIMTYNLENWKNKSAKNQNIDEICCPVLKELYICMIRIRN